MFNIDNKKRIVIKVGTSTLTHRTGRLNLRRVEKLVKVMSDIHNSGKDIILVSSGAVSLGMSKMGLMQRPSDTPTKQACASVGQCELMYMYDKQFGEYGLTVGQVLLTKYVLENDSRINVKNTLNKLLEHGIIPVINENDTVAIDELELEMGENDSLAAVVGGLASADLLIIMSDIDGLYDSNPNDNPDAKLIPYVEKITDEIRSLAGGPGSKLGKGGMITKIKAAEIANENGMDMIIVNGRNPSVLYRIFDGEEAGTVFATN